MSIKDLVPIRRRRGGLRERRRGERGLPSLQDEFNRVFDSFFEGFGLEPFHGVGGQLGTFSPRVDVAETDKLVKVSAELPGLDEKDIEVSLDEDILTIRGEKSDEREEKDEAGNWYRTERSYGSFHRSIPLPADVDGGKVKAKFKKGVLAITLPKLAPTESRRKTIDITAE